VAGKKILIIDDDKDLRLALSIRLRASGYDVAMATDAISAMSVALKERPDLVLLDVNMPGGNGFMIMERFRMSTHLESTPVIVLTGGDPIVYREKAFNLGAVDFFEKPADNDALLASIKRTLGKSV
jgi:putative two-component system response regulator